MNKKILLIFIHPITLAVIIGVVIIALIPPIPKYKIKQAAFRNEIPTTTIIYFDLDNDGTSERINFHNTPQKPDFLIFKNEKIINQWDLSGEFALRDFFFTADYDHNGRNEVYTITLFRDSIFINCINPFIRKPESVFYSKFLDTYHKSIIGIDCDVEFCKASDLNGDGYRELVFTITTGFSAYPRKFYAVDIKNDTVLTSPESCLPLLNPFAFDINCDGFDEFMADNKAFTNCEDLAFKYEYNDSSGWITLFDHNLRFCFNPIRIGGVMSQVKIRPIRGYSEVYLLATVTNPGDGKGPGKLILFSIQGEFLRERTLDTITESGECFPFLNNSFDGKQVFLTFQDGKIEQIDSDLKVVNTIHIEAIDNNRPIQLDIDQDGFDEFVFTANGNQGLIITRNDLTHPVKIPFKNDTSCFKYFSLFQKKGQHPQLFLQAGTNLYYFDYSKNPFYLFRFLFYAGILLLLYGIIFLITKAQKIRMQHKYETEKKIAELQLKAIKNRVDPHFTLNLMNSIGNLYEKHDSQTAGFILGKYGKLLRNIIVGSDSIETSLESELEYVKNYLDLEKFRMNDRFDYTISVNQNIDLTISVPKMILLNFVENAVKHGLRYLEKDGKIDIVIKKDQKEMIVSIQDNGMGRKHAINVSSEGTGKGLEITNTILSLYRDLKKINITYQIKDLTDNENRPIGTLVTILIPQL